MRMDIVTLTFDLDLQSGPKNNLHTCICTINYLDHNRPLNTTHLTFDQLVKNKLIKNVQVFKIMLMDLVTLTFHLQSGPKNNLHRSACICTISYLGLAKN